MYIYIFAFAFKSIDSTIGISATKYCNKQNLRKFNDTHFCSFCLWHDAMQYVLWKEEIKFINMWIVLLSFLQCGWNASFLAAISISIVSLFTDLIVVVKAEKILFLFPVLGKFVHDIVTYRGLCYEKRLWEMYLSIWKSYLWIKGCQLLFQSHINIISAIEC